MKKNNLFIMLLVLAFNLGCIDKKIDSIVINAKIYTVNKDNFIAKSLAINNGKIIDVSEENLDKLYTAKSVIDAMDRTILPGLIDSHCHFYGLGLD